MLQIEVSAGVLENVHASQIRLTASGDGNDATHITGVKIWLDANGNGVKEPGDTLLGSGIYPADNGVATISLNHVISKGASERWLVTYDLNQTLALIPARPYLSGSRGNQARIPWFMAVLALLLIPFAASTFTASPRRFSRLLLLFVLASAALTVTTCGGGGGPTPVIYKYTVSLMSPSDLTLAGTDSGLSILPTGTFPVTGTTLSVQK